MRLREVLLNVPKERFDIHEWRCGSAACAIGWGCQDPVLNGEGLHYREAATDPAPIFNGFFGWDAVEQCFGMNFDEATSIFAGRGYSHMTGKVGPRDVVAKIDRFLQENDHEADGG